MEEIQLGEYVRTKNKGIKKVETIFENKTVNRYGYKIIDKDGDIGYLVIKTTEILNHSFNIIDLIRKGDYVNGYLVIKVDAGYVYVNRETADGKTVTFTDYQIKSIVTREQMKAMEYEVK